MGFHNEHQAYVVERVDKAYAYGIKPRNAEQAFALHAIRHPDVNLVAICGVAGHGQDPPGAGRRARAALAAYDQIILSRARSWR